MRRFDKKVWGIPGKMNTYYSPGKFMSEKRIVPLNANPLDSWDVKTSRYRRVDLVPREPQGVIQQGGTVIGQETSAAPVVSPTPTPSFTPTNTVTPTITPSSTPLPLPETPSLWFDASDVAYLTLVPSGGTNYVQSITSKGTTGWVVQQLSTNRMPVYSGSSRFPGSPNIIRFFRSSSGLEKGMLGVNQPTLTTTGTSVFMVFANPVGNTVNNGWNFAFYTGSSVGFYTTNTYRQNNGVLVAIQNAITYSAGSTNNTNIPSFSSASLNEMYLTNQIGVKSASTSTFEINQSGGTGTAFSGTVALTNANTIILGGVQNITSGGAVTYTNNDLELAEIMVFNRILSYSEQLQVKSYLRDKWRYDEWASPVPTPTPSRT